MPFNEKDHSLRQKKSFEDSYVVDNDQICPKEQSNISLKFDKSYIIINGLNSRILSLEELLINVIKFPVDPYSFDPFPLSKIGRI